MLCRRLSTQYPKQTNKNNQGNDVRTLHLSSIPSFLCENRGGRQAEDGSKLHQRRKKAKADQASAQPDNQTKQQPNGRGEGCTNYIRLAIVQLSEVQYENWIIILMNTSVWPNYAPRGHLQHGVEGENPTQGK